MMFSGEGKTVCVFFFFLSGEDELSKETHVSFNAIVKFSGRREDTEEEWESSAEREGRELKIEIKFKKKKKKRKRHTEAASRREQNKDRRRTACETKRWEGGTGAKSELRDEWQEVPGGLDVKTRKDSATGAESDHPHFHKDFKTISSAPFLQLIHNETLWGGCSDPQWWTQQSSSALRARGKKQKKKISSIPQMRVQANRWKGEQFPPPHPRLKYPWKILESNLNQPTFCYTTTVSHDYSIQRRLALSHEFKIAPADMMNQLGDTAKSQQASTWTKNK